MLWNNLVRCFQKKGSVKKIWLWLLGVDILLRHFFKLCPIPSEKAREAAIGLIKVTECYGAIYTVSKLKIKKKKRNQHKAFLRKKSHLLENNQRRRQQQWRHGLSLGGCGALRSATPAVEETEHHELVHLCAAAVTQKWHHHEWVNATPASFVVS